MFTINFLAIILAAVAAFIVGFLMHGPVAGKLWMRLANVVPTGNEKFSDMVPQMVWNLVANFFTALVLSMVYFFASFYIAVGSWFTVFIVPVLLMWVFTVAGSSMEVIWMGKKRSLWIFECFSSLLTLAAMGAVIVMFY